MSKPTPGPWRAEFGEAVRIRAPDDTSIATINWLRGPHGYGGRIPTNEGEANALLVAAAPVLLELLREVGTVAPEQEWWDRRRVVLARIDGETP